MFSFWLWPLINNYVIFVLWLLIHLDINTELLDFINKILLCFVKWLWRLELSWKFFNFKQTFFIIFKNLFQIKVSLFNVLSLIRSKPLKLRTIFPYSYLSLTFFWEKYTKAMLPAIVPPTGILFLIRPRVDSVSMFLVVLIESFVHSTVLPSV